MSDFTVVNLQDLTTATSLSEQDLLPIAQGARALNKATVQQVGAFLGISAAVKVGDKNTTPTNPSFAFAESGTYSAWGEQTITSDLGILTYDGVNYGKTEINFVANGQVAQGDTRSVSGGEVWKQSNLNIVNLSLNGDFSNDLNNWTVGANITDATVTDGILSFTGKGGVATGANQIQQTSLPSTNDKIFVKIVAKGTGNYVNIGRGTTTSGVTFSLTTDFKENYAILTDASTRLKFGGAINANVQVKNISAYNLTQIFGAGNEPSAEEFNIMLDSGLNLVQSKIIDVRKIALDSTKKADTGYSEGETIKNLKQVEFLTNLTLTNLNNLGDFTSTLNWTVGTNITNSSISGGTYKFTGSGEPLDSANSVYRIFSAIPNANKVLISVVAKSNNNATFMYGRGVGLPIAYQKLDSNFKRFSSVFDAESTRIKIGANLGGNVEIDSISVLDLTSIFGAGNEPSADYLNQILNIVGYFENTKVINNPDLRSATELEIKSLKNKIKPQIKVLLIGSSHGMDTILNFPTLANYGGVSVVGGNLYAGGNDIVDVANKIQNNLDFASFALHFGSGGWNLQNVGVTGGRTFDVAVKSYDWDVIIIQRGALQSDTWTQEQKDAMFFVINHINSITHNNPEVMFNSGFSLPIDTSTGYTKQDQLNRTELINITAQQAQQDNYFEVLPVCTAIQNARNTFLNNYGTWTDKDIARDKTHLDVGIGSYVAGCVLFEKIIKPRFNISIRNMNYIPTRTDVSGIIATGSIYTAPTITTMRIAKLSAISAVMNPFELSETLPINFPA